MKKAEAYFRVLPDDVPVFSHFDPSMYLLQHPAMPNGKGKPMQDTPARFEQAFERIARFI